MMIRFFIDSKELSAFIDELMESGFKDLEVRLQRDMKSQLLDQLDDDFQSFLADNLQTQDAEIVNGFVRSGDRAGMQKFIEQKIPDSITRIRALMGRFRDFYVPKA